MSAKRVYPMEKINALWSRHAVHGNPQGLFMLGGGFENAVNEAVADALATRPETEATDDVLERMVEAYTSYQSSADRGLAQQMEGMRLALAAAGQRAEAESLKLLRTVWGATDRATLGNALDDRVREYLARVDGPHSRQSEKGEK